MKSKLREIRKATIDPDTGKSMTAEKLGKLIGKSKAQVLRLEDGSRDFTLQTLGRCCEVLKCYPGDITDLFPASKKQKGYDVELMELSLGCMFEACEHYGLKPDKKHCAQWARKIYEGAVSMNVKQLGMMRDLAMMIVKPATKAKSPKR